MEFLDKSANGVVEGHRALPDRSCPPAHRRSAAALRPAAAQALVRRFAEATDVVHDYGKEHVLLTEQEQSEARRGAARTGALRRAQAPPPRSLPA